MAPSDDPAAYNVDTTVTYDAQLSEPTWVVPSPALPATTPPNVANNNLDIIFHEDRLFFAWRTAETHWVFANAVIYVVSSRDGGQTWEDEYLVDLGSDVRRDSSRSRSPLFLLV